MGRRDLPSPEPDGAGKADHHQELLPGVSARKSAERKKKETYQIVNKNRRVIALGFFDGVHNGHGALLRRVVDKAQELDAAACAFTFDRSPTAAITGQTVPLLSSVEDRGWLMRSRYGIQEVVVSNFDGMMRMDWEDFVDRYLAEELGAVHGWPATTSTSAIWARATPSASRRSAPSWASDVTSSPRWSRTASPSLPPTSAP